METIPIRTLRQTFAEHVNRAVHDDVCIGISRDGKPIAAIVPFNAGVFLEEIRSVTGITGLIACLRNAKGSHDDALIKPFVMNALEKSVSQYLSSDTSLSILDMNTKVSISDGKVKSIEFQNDEVSGYFAIIDAFNNKKFIALINIEISGDILSIELSNNKKMNLQRKDEQSFVINGEDIEGEIDLELTRIILPS